MIRPPLTFRPGEVAVFRGTRAFSSFNWARENMRIIAGPFKGHLWSPDVSPQARPILSLLDRDHVRKAYLIAPSQSTKTTIAHAFFFSQLAKRRDNWGIGVADQNAAGKVVEGKLHPYFKSSPALRGMLATGDALTKYDIRLDGDAWISAMWAGSDSRMRSDSYPYLHIDEEDVYLDKSAAATMEERADAYVALGMSKIIHTCRPQGNEDQSVIWNAATTQAQAWCMYEMRCPVCHTYQVMEHRNIVAADGSREPGRIRVEKLGRYRCVSCGALWSNSGRNLAARAGRMVAVRGDMDEATVLAFHLRSWESTLVCLSEVLARWFEAQGNPMAMQRWDNNECAQPYRFISVESDEDKLAQRIDPELDTGVVPGWALCLTLAADMQKDHFYWSVCAHGLAPERYHIVDYGRVQTWDELDAVIYRSRYRTVDGREFGIWRAALDTGGTKHEDEDVSRPMQAYKWLLAQRPGVVYGTKGMSRTSPGIFVKTTPIDTLPNGHKLTNPYVLHLLDPDAFKRQVFWRLSDGGEEEPLTFHARTDRDYLRQVASERLEKGKDGVERWKRFRANHYLDCLVGHEALAHWQWKPSLAQLAQAQQQAARAEEARHAAQPVRQDNPYTGGMRLFGTE
ncbi:terminase gpA endonuclease subunit [Nitratidesulfovibrio liaohensis]|uniref:Phage terminase large subunit family protein n=1 Tax=Nitratidesulfovibrio liaohensis TaxID=2604158 RepID=A0ABY9R7L3_9BACT|nr:terminase gpA endonuclease subunit [Nitratidesulfovibrio liaohensis]WMW67306.1 phage terminase large subunit family protein [Nitratidesulfovibrio liaohensis]